MTNELWRMSAVEAVARLRKGEISPLELVEASAQRIGEIEPAVNALPTLCLERAREHARHMMQGGAACEAAGEAGWLAGLPVSIKDLTDVAGVRTTYGSPLFADHVPAKSHPLVERIERKGGIVMGKSNTPEFGAGGSTFNEVFGRTRNPWNTSLPSGGSTGGCAVSVATGEVWLAQGTDHGGSLRGPGSHRSGVGLRATPRGGERGAVAHPLGHVFLAGAGHRPWRLVARPGQPLLGRRPAAIARACDARHCDQSLEPAFRAGANGTQCGRPRIVSWLQRLG